MCTALVMIFLCPCQNLRFSKWKKILVQREKKERNVLEETKHETTVGNSTKSYKHGTAKREAVVGVTRMRKWGSEGGWDRSKKTEKSISMWKACTRMWHSIEFKDHPQNKYSIFQGCFLHHLLLVSGCLWQQSVAFQIYKIYNTK